MSQVTLIISDNFQPDVTLNSIKFGFDIRYLAVYRTVGPNVTCHTLNSGQRTSVLGVSQVTRARTSDPWATVLLVIVERAISVVTGVAIAGLEFAQHASSSSQPFPSFGYPTFRPSGLAFSKFDHLQVKTPSSLLWDPRSPRSRAQRPVKFDVSKF